MMDARKSCMQLTSFVLYLDAADPTVHVCWQCSVQFGTNIAMRLLQPAGLHAWQDCV